MQIIIVGCGNVGSTLAEQLGKEGHNITVIDIKEQLVEDISNTFDVLGIAGNGASFSVLTDAGVNQADLLIAVTGSDELNLLCCLIARKAGGCHTIARVSNPVYSREISFIKEELGLSMIINPKLAAAREISRLLKFPSALQIDTFAKGRVEIIKYRIEAGSLLCNMPLKEIGSKLKCEVLISVVERGEEVYIPDGNFVLQEKDEISVVAATTKAVAFFKKLGVATTRAKDAMIIGGGDTGFYLAKQLLDMGVKVKIIERDKQRSELLSELLPQAMIICGDATDKEILMEEGLPNAESVVTMTEIDEENIMLSLYAKSLSKAKIITRVHRIAYDEIIEGLDMGSVIYPKYITASSIVQYVRAMHNSIGSNVETLYKMNEDRVEALEFLIKEESAVVGVTLQSLSLKRNVLISCINHKGNIIIPRGQDMISVGDTVIVVTTITGMHDITDILA